MKRRTLVQLSAAAILLPTAAFAQSSQTSVSLEAKHAADTLEAGAVALETSRVALSKATDPTVKRFAQFEVAEQETVATVVKTAARLSVDPKPAETGKAVIDTLSAMQAGKSFDVGFVEVQIDGHKALLQIQEKYLSDGKDVMLEMLAKALG
ncbi:DUF4142 domain-containing protein [Bosea sp. NPDC055353]